MDDVYQIQHPELIFSPGLVVFKDLVAHNLQTMLSIAGGPARLRPHCKTHKMPAVIKLELELGITKHKSATIAEAEMLATAGVQDIFLAYNIIGPNVWRMVAFRKRFPDVQLIVTGDDSRALRILSNAIANAGTHIGVALDVNPGRDRTGVVLDDAAIQLYHLIESLPGLIPAGLHLYDGHLQHSKFEERLSAVNSYWEEVCRFTSRLAANGFQVPRIICGGTPTFPAYATLDDPVIELSPGTCVFHDWGYGERFSDLKEFIPAALLLTRVISRPTANRITFDLGTKSIASDPPMGQRLYLPDLPDAIQVMHNEEHLVVETSLANQYQPGDWTLAIPMHICPCCALHQSATVIQNGEVVECWDVVGRDRFLTI